MAGVRIFIGAGKRSRTSCICPLMPLGARKYRVNPQSSALLFTRIHPRDQNLGTKSWDTTDNRRM